MLSCINWITGVSWLLFVFATYVMLRNRFEQNFATALKVDKIYQFLLFDQTDRTMTSRHCVCTFNDVLFVVLLQQRHCMLNVHPEAIEKMIEVGIHPIVIFIKHESAKQIRSIFTREWWRHRSWLISWLSLSCCALFNLCFEETQSSEIRCHFLNLLKFSGRIVIHY